MDGHPLMARFIKLALAEYDWHGIPEDLDADDQWINIDHIQRIRELITDNHTRTHQTGGTPAYYPAIELTLSSGQEHLVFLGAHASIDTAEDAIRRFLPLLLNDAASRDDAAA